MWLHDERHNSLASRGFVYKMLGIMFSAEKRLLIIEHYFRMESYKKVIEWFQNKFLGTSVPNKSTIKRIVDNFSNHYTLEPKKKARRKMKLTLERISNIRKRLKNISEHISKKSCFTIWCPSFYGICCFKTIRIARVSSYSAARIETTGSTKMTSLLRVFLKLHFQSVRSSCHVG